MSTTTEDVAADLAFLTAVAERRDRVVKAVVELQELLRDIPRLVALSERGLLDRALIQQHAGHQERAAAVRELHEPLELIGARLVCTHCSGHGPFVEFPCPTLVALDG